MINAINGRSIMVEFNCCRCGCKKVVPVSYGFGYYRDKLEDIPVPDGWLDRGVGEIFCQKCAEEFHRFMHPTEDMGV